MLRVQREPSAMKDEVSLPVIKELTATLVTRCTAQHGNMSVNEELEGYKTDVLSLWII
jgi:hypothetical protein